MTYRGGSYLFGQYGVCALCCVACPFGGSIAPSQTRQWTSYCASLFSILPTINCKPNLREGKLVWRSQSDALGARCVFCGPIRACASFAPTMSVRIFGHFEQFSMFSARRALCSAHPCTPDAWTNGPYMTWLLCILVPMVHTPRGRSGATSVKALAQSECGQFCHFGICGPNWDRHQARWHGDL